MLKTKKADFGDGETDEGWEAGKGIANDQDMLYASASSPKTNIIILYHKRILPKGKRKKKQENIKQI